MFIHYLFISIVLECIFVAPLYGLFQIVKNESLKNWLAVIGSLAFIAINAGCLIAWLISVSHGKP